jgi:hypothetical protein
MNTGVVVDNNLTRFIDNTYTDTDIKRITEKQSRNSKAITDINIDTVIKMFPPISY